MGEGWEWKKFVGGKEKERESWGQMGWGRRETIGLPCSELATDTDRSSPWRGTSDFPACGPSLTQFLTLNEGSTLANYHAFLSFFPLCTWPSHSSSNSAPGCLQRHKPRNRAGGYRLDPSLSPAGGLHQWHSPAACKTVAIYSHAEVSGIPVQVWQLMLVHPPSDLTGNKMQLPIPATPGSVPALVLLRLWWEMGMDVTD